MTSFIRFYNWIKIDTANTKCIKGVKSNCGNKALLWTVNKDGSEVAFNKEPARF